MAATEGVPAGRCAAVVGVCRGWRAHLGRRMLVGVCVDSRLRRVVVGKPPGPVRCRVPYLLDASPWRRRKKSRVTTEAA
jgi:hypothetical protein